MEQLLSLFVRAGNQNMVLLQKAVIKFIKVLVISEDGKEAFREANGLSVLHSSLEKILQRMYSFQRFYQKTFSTNFKIF